MTEKANSEKAYGEINREDFFVCIKPTVHKGVDALKIALCGDDEPNKYHVSESQRCYDDMTKMANHMKVDVVTWTPKNKVGFIPEISINKWGSAYMKLSNGKRSSKTAVQSLNINDVLAVK